MKKEYSDKPRKQRLKQEIKEEYFEQSDDILVKSEEEDEEEKEGESIFSNGPCNNPVNRSPTEEPIWETNPTFESEPRFTFSRPVEVEVKSQVWENGPRSLQQLPPVNNAQYTFASPPSPQ